MIFIFLAFFGVFPQSARNFQKKKNLWRSKLTVIHRQFGLTSTLTSLNRPFGLRTFERPCIVDLDTSKYTNMYEDRPFGRSVNVYLDHPIIRSRVVQMDSPRMCIWMVQIHGVKASIWTAKFRPNGRYVFIYLDASKSTVQWRPNGRSPNGRFREVRVDVNPN